MKLNLSKMGNAQEEFEAKRANSSKGAPVSSYLLDELLGVIRWAVEEDACRVCAGGGWVGPHEMGCPIDIACSKIKLRVLTQRCPQCSRRAMVFGGVTPSKFDCEMCQFSNVAAIAGARDLARQRHERLERKGKSQAAARCLSEAKRLSRLYKEATGQPFGKKTDRGTVRKSPKKDRSEKR